MNIHPRYLLLATLSVAIGLWTAGCKSNPPANSSTPQGQDQTQAQDQSPNDDPANENVAPIPNSTQTSYLPSGQAASGQPEYGSDQGENYDYNNPDYYNNYDNYDQPVEYANQAPPPLPQYDQPPCPGDDYIWTPGYWDWAPQGYYWVPGAWVHAPYQGALWTPGYWSFRNGRYGWHRGFWGRHVGYYGGIDYGYGYTGYGYQGGYWNGDNFDYNRAVNNVNASEIHHLYDYRVNNRNSAGRVSYNGPGGVQVKPRAAEIVALHEQHNAPMAAQVQQRQEARTDTKNFANFDRGRPQVMAVAKPLPADKNVKAPPPVPMRHLAPASNNARNGEPPRPGEPRPSGGPAHRTPSAPEPRANEPARAGQPTPQPHAGQQVTPMRQQSAPHQQQPIPEQQQHAAPVQHPQYQQPAPERQAPQRHAQPAPERQGPAVQHPAQQHPAPVEHPVAPQHNTPAPEQRAAPQHQQQQRPAPVAHPARNEHANPRATEHKPEPKKKSEEKKPQ